MSDSIEIGNTKPRIRFAGDGETTQFYFSFPIFSPDDIEVYFDDQLQTSGYTVSRNEEDNGGCVAFDAAPASGVIITLFRNLELKRTTDFQEAGPFRSSKVNLEFDYQLACMKQLEEAISRTVTFPPYSSTNLNVSLPTPEAGKSIIWNQEGNSLVNSSAEIEKLAHVYEDCVDLKLEAAQKAEEAGSSAEEAAASAETAGQYAARAELAMGKTAIPLFTIFQSFSGETPPGAYPLWTGENITGCRTIFPDFWNKAVALKTAGKLRALSAEAYEAEISSYGETGAFVIDEQSGSLRLPKITRFVSSLSELSEIGTAAKDQIVNITGTVNALSSPFTNDNNLTTEGAFYQHTLINGGDGGGGNYANYILGFDASRSVQTGSEVQPRHVKTALYIQIYSAAVPASTAQAAEFVNGLNGKADANLGNTPLSNMADYIVENWEASDGNTWYQLYNSGKLVQGGYIPPSSGTYQTITFPKAFANTTYVVAGVTEWKSSNYGYFSVNNEKKYTYGFTTCHSAIPAHDWLAIGKI